MGSAYEVSVVIPTFNRPEYLREAITSALSQTESCEVVVVAHGASPATLEVMQEFSGEIVSVVLARDFGPHFSWLHGILAASGEIIKILYDDDLMNPSFVEKTLPLFTETVGIVFSAAQLIDEEGHLIPGGELYQGILRHSGVVRNDANFRRRARDLISPGATLVRKKDAIDAFFQGSLPFEKDSYFGVGPDHFLKLLCMLRYPAIGYIDEPLVSFRSHSDSITIASQTNQKSREQFYFAYIETYLHYRMLRFGKPYLETLRYVEKAKYLSKALIRKALRQSKFL